MCNGSPAANFLLIFALLEEKELTISDSVFITSAYNEIYYIARILCLRKCDVVYRKKGNNLDLACV
jgi:hypothetical protein